MKNPLLGLFRPSPEPTSQPVLAPVYTRSGASSPPQLSARVPLGPLTDARASRSLGRGVLDTLARELCTRSPSPGGAMSALGATFERLGPALKRPSELERSLANHLGGLFAAGPLGSDRYRTAAAVQEAWARPPVVAGRPLGATTLVCPGLGNTAPGPAQIARLLKYC